VFFVLMRLRRRGAAPGASFGIYLALAGTARFLVEFVRLNPRAWLGLTVAQFVSVGLVVIGLALVLRARSSAPRPAPSA